MFITAFSIIPGILEERQVKEIKWMCIGKKEAEQSLHAGDIKLYRIEQYIYKNT